MALTLTSRLRLAKQDKGDNNWHTSLNDGFDDADARLFKTDTAADPNSAEEAHYVGQRYWDQTNGLWWTATAVGNPGTWVRDADQIDTEITHPATPTTLAEDYPHGHLNAILEWVSATVVRLRPIGGNTIYVDISGGRETITGAFDFDITTDREGAQTEDSDTYYYLYLDNDTTPGTLLPVVSKTAPLTYGEATPGYHPTLADHRCVGSIYNDWNSDIRRFFANSGGFIAFDPTARGTTDQELLYYSSEKTTPDLTLTGSPTWRNLALNLPETAAEVRIFAHIRQKGTAGYWALSADGATGVLPGATTVLLGDAGIVDAIAVMQGPANDYAQIELTIPIVDSAFPAMSYGSDDEVIMAEIMILGYQDFWAPRGY